MKFIIQRLLGAIVAYLLGVSLAQADTVNTMVFSKPGQYCFEQTSLRGELDKTILDHHLLIPVEDHYKAGDVFVGFRRNSKADALWLSNGFHWRTYDDSEFPYMNYLGTTELQPVIQVMVSYQPMDLNAFRGDGEIWVGYGLRKDEAATRKDSFQDMIDNHRYYRVWQIGALTVSGLNPTICLTATQMTERVGISNTNTVPTQ